MSAKGDRLRTQLPSFDMEPAVDPDAVAPPSPPRKLRAEPEQAPTAVAAPPSVSSEAAGSPAEPPKVSSKPKTAPKATPAPTGSEEAGERSAYFRSFYVDNGVFERFRAAIFWTARNPQAAGQVPENMSVAVEDAIEQIASDLERRYNDGKPFPEAQQTRRRRRAAQS